MAHQKIEGGCSCGHIRYKLQGNPFVVHCCHCRWCQCQTGSAFTVNALYKSTNVELLNGVPQRISMPSPSGNGQTIARCPKCEVAVWSNYFMGGIKEGIRFIRVGTLDCPDLLPPDVHIFTKSKQPWVIIPSDVKAVEIFYNYEDIWSVANQKKRLEMLRDTSDHPFQDQLAIEK